MPRTCFDESYDLDDKHRRIWDTECHEESLIRNGNIAVVATRRYLHCVPARRKRTRATTVIVVTVVVVSQCRFCVKRILSISILVCGSNANTSPSISFSWQVLQSTVLPMLNQSLAPAIFHCRQDSRATRRPSRGYVCRCTYNVILRAIFLIFPRYLLLFSREDATCQMSSLKKGVRSLQHSEDVEAAKCSAI